LRPALCDSQIVVGQSPSVPVWVKAAKEPSWCAVLYSGMCWHLVHFITWTWEMHFSLPPERKKHEYLSER
jgi:hypothetical protein